MADQTGKLRGALLGLAVGDALGTSVEFSPRGSLTPVTEMRGGGPFHLTPGEWTDDTSMALCLADSLISCGGFDAQDQMRRYMRWLTDGYLSSSGRCFDVGNTVLSALRTFQSVGGGYCGSTNPRSAGNGSIMRLAPVAIYYYPDLEKVIHFSAESSRTTHGAPECLEACALLAEVLHRCFSGWEKSRILEGDFAHQFESANIARLSQLDYSTLTEDDIVGSGYVVRCLEAALWSFFTTESFEDAVLNAVNLGDDADTTGAVTGQIAGAFYGVEAIPSRWLTTLAKRELIEDFGVRLCERK